MNSRIFFALPFLLLASEAFAQTLATPTTLTPPLAGQGINPSQTTAAASSLVVKAAPGNLYHLDATASAAGFVLVFDATTVPASGTVTPDYCLPLAAGAGLSVSFDVPRSYMAGIVLAYSSGASCYTFTPSATAFLSAMAQ